ncbi:hypothetical protein QJQ45_008084 [Haematococcus lacustris]|nr:hypothetical protein QJQ45_008084 [Haematococcus lacustris]
MRGQAIMLGTPPAREGRPGTRTSVEDSSVAHILEDVKLAGLVSGDCEAIRTELADQQMKMHVRNVHSIRANNPTRFAGLLLMAKDMQVIMGAIVGMTTSVLPTWKALVTHAETWEAKLPAGHPLALGVVAAFKRRAEMHYAPVHAAAYVVDPAHFKPPRAGVHARPPFMDLTPKQLEDTIDTVARLSKASTAAVRKELTDLKLGVWSDDMVRDVAGIQEQTRTSEDGKTVAADISVRRGLWDFTAREDYPLFSEAATRLLSMHITTAAAERNWSAWGDTFEAGRAQLGIKKAEMMVYIHANIPKGASAMPSELVALGITAMLLASQRTARLDARGGRTPRSTRSVLAAAKLRAADRVALGDSDLQISVCTLGTMTWGMQNTEAEAHEQLSYAADQCVRLLAHVTGAGLVAGFWKSHSRQLCPNLLVAHDPLRPPPCAVLLPGTWLKGRKRDSVVVLTKVAGYSANSTWVRNPPRTTRVTRDQIRESVDASLSRLQTDYVDLLQIHWPDRYVPLFGGPSYDPSQQRPDDVPFEEQLRGLEEVIKAGKVRHIGVSNETSYGVAEFVHLAKTAGLPKICSIQNSYSLLNRGQYETDLAETCLHHKVGLLAYSPLAGGGLTGKYNVGQVDPKARFNLFAGYMERYTTSTVKAAVGDYMEVASKHGLTPTQLALAWCRSRWCVTSSIIGATSMEQLKENLEAFDKDISQECLDAINAVYKKFRDPTLR